MSGEHLAPSDLPPDAAAPLLSLVDLELDQGCYRDLTWRCTPRAGDVDVARLAQALAASGYDLDSRNDKIIYLHHRAGHVLVMVPATGRIQIRLHYLTGADKRPLAAQVLAAQIETTLRQMTDAPA